MELDTIENFLAEQNNITHKLSSQLQLKRTVDFLSLLGNPQEKIKTIHVAGTSGKGSTSYLTSLLLQSQNFKVGLFQSPHIRDFIEMFQVNNKLIDKEKFTRYFNQLLPYIEKAKDGKYGPPSSFEIITGLAFYIFAKEQVDYAVIETGLGGLYDATNVIDNKNKLAIITKIGLDHTDILGNDITSIAQHKAGIIQKGNTVITIMQEKDAQEVIEKEVQEQGAAVYVLNKDQNYSLVSKDTKKTVFNFSFLGTTLNNISLFMKGVYQVENCSQALSALVFLAKRDNFSLDVKGIHKALETAQLPGRMEIKRINEKLVILDGAHNPQKMQAFMESIKALYPNQTFDILFAVKKGKDYKDILTFIIPLANTITITSFKTINMAIQHESEEPLVIAKELEILGFSQYKIVPEVSQAVENVIASKNPVIITGSLYLIATVYPLL